jgi:hypothetical protein
VQPARLATITSLAAAGVKGRGMILNAAVTIVSWDRACE